VRPQTASRQNSNSCSHLPQRFFLALVMLVCVALPTATQAGGCDAGLTVSISGVSLATGCFADCLGGDNNASFAYSGFNGVFGFDSFSTLSDWCGSPIEGCIYIRENLPGYTGTLSFNADCSSPDVTTTDGVDLIVVHTGGGLVYLDLQ
jgi:hypothetical protein